MEIGGYILLGLAIFLILVFIGNIKIVPQAYVYVVERLGAFHAAWSTGLHVTIPFFDRVAKKVSLKDQVLDFKPQSVITKDNVSMQIDTVVFFQITNAMQFTYGVERPISAIENLTATTLRNIVGNLDLQQTLTSRDIINTNITKILDEATDRWGIKVQRVELKNILPPREIQEAMDKQMKADREKREKVTQAEAEKEAKIALAQGEAESIRLVYEAQAEGLEKLREAHIDQSVLKLKGLEALRDVADGKATKIYMPTEIAGLVSTLGVAAESLGIGDATKISHADDVEVHLDEDPCVNETTSKVGKEAAKQGAEVARDLESRRKDII